MLDCVILGNGNLQLTVEDTDDRIELSAYMEDDHYYFWQLFSDLLEDYSSNGSYTLFDAGDGNPNVGLTSAPCIAEGMDILDGGKREIVGRFWYYDNYQIDCPLEKLRDTGEVVFTLAS